HALTHIPFCGAMLTGQVKPHDVPSQVGIPSCGAGQAVHDVGPQLVTALLLTQLPLQRWKPLLQVLPQLVPSQVVVAFGGGGSHGVQSCPQVSVLLLSAQVSPQRWKPWAASQVKSQLTPSQVGTPLAGAVHGAHSEPQVAGSLSLAQVPPQR